MYHKRFTFDWEALPVSSADSITQWIDQLKQGHREAAQDLWARYVDRLIRLASSKLQHAPRRLADEEDVVVCAFAAFLRGVEAGRFSQLEDRHDLWQILVMLTERKAVDQMRAESAEKRGGGKTRGDSAFGTAVPDSAPKGFEQVTDPRPTPEFAVQASENLQELLQQLDDETLQSIAIAKMEGYANAEIAKQVNKSVATVERKLSLIRDIWSETRTQ